MAVEVGQRDAGGERALDLSAELGLDLARGERARHETAQHALQRRKRPSAPTRPGIALGGRTGRSS